MRKDKRWLTGLLAFGTVMLLGAGRAFAEGEAEASLYTDTVGLDTLWVLVAAFLVFFMNTGFGCVEAGFCRAKNAINILGKNFVVFGIATLAFWVVGWSLMFGDDMFGKAAGYVGWGGFFLNGADNSPATKDAYEGVYSAINWTGVPLLAKFFFQLVFAGTAATIVSGCVAERIHYRAFMVFTVVLVAIAYPISGHWIWGGGWLQSRGMWDFAGSTVVHSVGGWAGLAGIIMLGPRIGKYRKDGKVHPIPGHSMGLVFIGGMVLWLGWFGFNPGSVMAIAGEAALSVAHVAITTNLACATGLIVATLVAWATIGKPDFGMTVNGALAGLVAITAPCAFVTPTSAAIIGAVAGAIVVGAVLFFDKLRIDDPVGALSVHLANGIWGTVAVGLFAVEGLNGITAGGLLTSGSAALLMSQLTGVVAVGALTLAISLPTWAIIKATLGLRVEPIAEVEGLDRHEMGGEAYPHEPAIDVSALLLESSLGRHEKGLLAAHPVAEARPAKMPPATARFTVKIEGVASEELMHKWSEWCGLDRGPSPELFKDVYAHVSTVQNNAFRFRDGDPNQLCQKLQKLAQSVSPSAMAKVQK